MTQSATSGANQTLAVQPLMHVYTLSFRNYISKLPVTFFYSKTKKAIFKTQLNAFWTKFNKNTVVLYWNIFLQDAFLFSLSFQRIATNSFYRAHQLLA